MADESWVGLAEALGQLRHELETALVTAPNPRIRFELGPVELEFTADVKKTGGLDGGVRWGILSFGAKGERVGESGHRLKLVLQPKDVLTDANAEVSATRAGLPPSR
jgi:hypothetical protein